MNNPVVIYSGLSLNIPAGATAATTSVTIPPSMFATWAATSNRPWLMGTADTVPGNTNTAEIIISPRDASDFVLDITVGGFSFVGVRGSVGTLNGFTTSGHNGVHAPVPVFPAPDVFAIVTTPQFAVTSSTLTLSLRANSTGTVPISNLSLAFIDTVVFPTFGDTSTTTVTYQATASLMFSPTSIYAQRSLILLPHGRSFGMVVG